MRWIPLGPGVIGLRLAKPIYGDKERILVKEGTTLTPSYIGALFRRGVFNVPIYDEVTADIEIDDVVSEAKRSSATSSVGEVFDVFYTALSDRKSGTSAQTLASADSAELQQVASSIRMASLYRAADDIVSEAIGRVQALSGLTFIKSHENYAYGHSVDTAIIAVLIGHRLRLSSGDLKRLARGCLLQDVGNVFVPKEILQKPRTLSPEEVEQVRAHAEAGYKLLRKMNREDIIPNHIAYQHHERQDGTGYPRGLKGTNKGRRDQTEPGYMMLLSEIAAVADVHDALSSDHPHRRALPPEQVVETMRHMAGSQLNREIVETFLSFLPVFPLGADVRIMNGRFRGNIGIVARINQHRLDRPVVRVLSDAWGKKLPTTVDLDLLENSELLIASLPARQPTAASMAAVGATDAPDPEEYEEDLAN